MSSILIDRDGPILRLTLNRPEVRNAFDEAVIQAISALPPARRGPVAARSLAGGERLRRRRHRWMAKAIAHSRQEPERRRDLARMLERLTRFRSR
jgi:methylglutaconyl-CoA hydratase